MILDYSQCSLEALYKMLSEQESSLERYRAQESSTKRKHKIEHDLWVAISHAKLERIQELRDEIISRKKEDTGKNEVKNG